MYEDIRRKFDDISLNYDRQRKQLIPCFEDFYGSALSLIEPACKSLSVLDIGAGSGLFSSFLLSKFPNARITLIDISSKMLEVAKQRFNGVEGIEYIVGDYTQHNFNQVYDIVISALSIHHLNDEQKISVFQKCYSSLRENGIFINCDQVLGETECLDSLYKKQWKSSIENSGLPMDEILSAYERVKLDKEATLTHQLQWLREVGFSDVACVYKYYHFAVMFGRKLA